MHRRTLKALLAAYRERWPQESAVVARFDDFVDSHPDCFHRSCRIGHITGSAWIVDTTGDRVLLVHHRKLGRWLQPGGHCDGDPDALAVALRETCEESGLDVRSLDDTIFDIDVHGIRPVAASPGTSTSTCASWLRPSTTDSRSARNHTHSRGFRRQDSAH